MVAFFSFLYDKGNRKKALFAWVKAGKEAIYERVRIENEHE